MKFDYSTLGSCGKDVYISPKATIKRPHLVHIGNHVAIDECVITTQMSIGSYIHISPYTSIIGGEDGIFVMGNFTTVAAGCRIICVSDEHLGWGLVGSTVPVDYRDELISKPIIIKDYSSLASNVVVAPGVTLEEGAVVGANSFIRNDVPAWEIHAGSPAKFIRYRFSPKMKAYGERLLAENR